MSEVSDAAVSTGESGDTCLICGDAISASDRQQIMTKKLAQGFCLKDSYAIRSFNQCCKSQKTEVQMEALRKDNPDLWKQTVLAFREQRSQGRGTRFDVLKHIETIKQAVVQDQDDVFRPLLYAQYIAHYTGLPDPLCLTETQASAQWHADLRNPKVKKSEKRYFNPKSRQDEVAWFNHFPTFRKHGWLCFHVVFSKQHFAHIV